MQVANILKNKGGAVRTVHPDTPLSDCVIQMEEDLGSLVVFDADGRLAGLLTFRVVSFHDVARSVYEEQQFENHMLKACIGDWPEERALWPS